MKEHPILMSVPMVRALKKGQKNQTRRLVNLDYIDTVKDGVPFFADEYGDYHKTIESCPYKVGDHLWVRETWRNHAYPLVFPSFTRYAADNIVVEIGKGPWRPSIHMPRWASRITLEITDVRVQRVEEIREEDAISEGVTFDGKYWRGATHAAKGTPRCMVSAKDAFMDVWDEIYGKRGCGWETNPWVWAYTFKVVK